MNKMPESSRSHLPWGSLEFLPPGYRFGQATLICLAVLLAVVGAAVGALFDDAVVARGKGFEIRQSQLEEAFTAFRAKLALRGQRVLEAERTAMEAQILEGLIASKLLVNRATPEDQARAKEQTGKLLALAKEKPETEEALKRQLKARGLPVERFEAQILEDETSRAVLDREIKSKLSVADAQVRELYDHGVDGVVRAMQAELERLARNPDTPPERLTQVKKQVDELKRSNLARLEVPERVRVSHILLATRDRQSEEELPVNQKKAKRELAEKLLVRARAGEDFAQLVQAHSEDKNLRETQGEYAFTREGPFVPEFKAASFSLQPGQISDIVTTMFGYHIIKLLERFPAKKADFPDAAPRIREALLEQAAARLVPRYLAELRQEGGVEVLDAKYSQALPVRLPPEPSLIESAATEAASIPPGPVASGVTNAPWAPPPDFIGPVPPPVR
jgi:parvulin-like peptidyl-prolyl isomerase